MGTFLDNWARSKLWESVAPERELVSTGANAEQPTPSEPARPTTSPTINTADARTLLTSESIMVRYIRTGEEAEAVVAKLASHRGHIGLDIETAKEPSHKAHSQAGLNPHLSRIRLIQMYAAGQEVFVFDLGAVAARLIRPLLDKRFVAHNAVFELQHMMHAGIEPTAVDCTMLQSNALTGKRPKLADLALDELGWKISKEQQTSDRSAQELTAEQIEYAALDAVIAHLLFPLLDRQVSKKRRRRCYELMRDAQHAIARMQLNGCFFDREAQLGVMQDWIEDRDRAHRTLVSHFGQGLNLASSPQLAAAFESKLAPEVLRRWPRGKSGQLSTGAKVLALFPEVAFVPTLQQWKISNRKLTSFGNRFAAHINPITGRVHASFIIGGTATGRLACRTPNIQNPPKDESFRALFAAPPGRVLVVADLARSSFA
jgi:DNA polymerase-1